jgi:tetratricopeptide (TPR) repeat protein
MGQKKKFILFIVIMSFLGRSPFVLAQEVSTAETKALYREGIKYATEGKFEEAEGRFRKNVGINQSDSTSLSSLGVFKDFKEGRINKENTISLFKGLNYAYEGEPEQAIAELHKVIEVDPKYPKTYNIMGIIYAVLNQPQQAITYFQKAIEINPKYTEACCNLAAVYQALGQYQEAITYYQRVVQEEPNSAEAYLSIGAAYASLAQYQEAATYYQKVIKIDPGQAKAYYGLGLVYLMLDQYTKSEENLQKAKELYQQKGDRRSVQATEEYLNKIHPITSAIKTSP